MPNMDVWDWLLLVGATFVAVASLVNLMRRRRDHVLADLDARAKVQREHKQQAQREARRKQKKNQAA